MAHHEGPRHRRGSRATLRNRGNYHRRADVMFAADVACNADSLLAARGVGGRKPLRQGAFGFGSREIRCHENVYVIVLRLIVKVGSLE